MTIDFAKIETALADGPMHCSGLAGVLRISGPESGELKKHLQALTLRGALVETPVLAKNGNIKSLLWSLPAADAVVMPDADTRATLYLSSRFGAPTVTRLDDSGYDGPVNGSSARYRSLATDRVTPAERVYGGDWTYRLEDGVYQTESRTRVSRHTSRIEVVGSTITELAD